MLLPVLLSTVGLGKGGGGGGGGLCGQLSSMGIGVRRLVITLNFSPHHLLTLVGSVSTSI